MNDTMTTGHVTIQTSKKRLDIMMREVDALSWATHAGFDMLGNFEKMCTEQSLLADDRKMLRLAIQVAAETGIKGMPGFTVREHTEDGKTFAVFGPPLKGEFNPSNLGKFLRARVVQRWYKSRQIMSTFMQENDGMLSSTGLYVSNTKVTVLDMDKKLADIARRDTVS